MIEQLLITSNSQACMTYILVTCFTLMFTTVDSVLFPQMLRCPEIKRSSHLSTIMNSEEMPLQTPRKLEAIRANFTYELSFITVSSAMLLQTARCLEAQCAQFTFKRPFVASRMNSKMTAQTAQCPEVSRANFTFESAIIVSLEMLLQGSRFLEARRAKFTFKRPFFAMNSKMQAQIPRRPEGS